MKEITAQDLKLRLQGSNGPFILDVRQADEFHSGHIEGAVLIPLGELPDRIHELDPKQEIVINCRSGARSARACQILEANGFQDVSNLVGGILAWQIESHQPR